MSFNLFLDVITSLRTLMSVVIELRIVEGTKVLLKTESDDCRYHKTMRIVLISV